MRLNYIRAILILPNVKHTNYRGKKHLAQLYIPDEDILNARVIVMLEKSTYKLQYIGGILSKSIFLKRITYCLSGVKLG